MTVAQKIKMQKESYNVGQAEVLMSTSVSSDQANQSGDNKIKCRKCDIIVGNVNIFVSNIYTERLR